MIRSNSTFLLTALIGLSVSPLISIAEENAPRPLAERPYLTMFIASLDRIRQACEFVYDSIDRPDLSQSISERLAGYRDFKGIDATKPAGIMTTWDEERPQEIVFVPCDDIQELLQTASFGIGYHEVTPHHYEIERPGSPYHVVIRKDYAYFGDDIETIQALRGSPQQFTQGLRDKYDLAIRFDLLQIPLSTKTAFVSQIRRPIEPWLQPQDHEDPEQASLRKNLGTMILDLIERFILDTKGVTIGGRIDPGTHHLSCELIVECNAKSRLATAVNRLAAYRSDYASLIQPEVPAGLAFNLPLGGLIDRLQGNDEAGKPSRSRLEAGVQLAGNQLGDLSMIAALHGPEIEKLNEALPRWLANLETAGSLVSLRENFEIHNGVVLHSLTPQEIPAEMTQWTGPNVEIIVGQAERTIWIGVGNPDSLLERLSSAIDLIEETTDHKLVGPLVRAQFRARTLPELIATDLLNSSAEQTRDELSRGGDGFSLTLSPVEDGLKLRLEFEEGFVRLVGRNWANQLNQTSTSP